MYPRKDINALSQGELDAYLHALDVLHRRSRVDPDDRSGYVWQARLHNDLEVGPCEHGNDLFFAWHRCHLYHFEQLLRMADPPRTANVSIPYWDWSRPDPAGGRYPARFSLPALSVPRLVSGPALAPDAITIVKRERAWNPFAGWPKGTPDHDYGAFEASPHNYMHGTYIGGVMGNPETAAEDPIYWSFHGFIDLLWAEWQRLNPAEQATSLGTELRGFAHVAQRHVRDFQSVGTLGYEYELNAALRADLESPLPLPVERRLLREESLRALFQGSLRDKLQATARLEYAVSEVEAGATRVLLTLRDLSVPKVASFTLRAYVHPRALPLERQSDEERQRHYAGYVAMWKAHAHTGHGGHGGHGLPAAHHPVAANVSVDATAVVARLTASGEQDLVATFHLVPAPLPSGAPAPVPELIREMELRDVSMEVFV